MRPSLTFASLMSTSDHVVRQQAASGAGAEGPRVETWVSGLMLSPRETEKLVIYQVAELARRRGERGACGLDGTLRVSAYTMLYGEGPGFGQPVFGVYTRGCALSCEFCYRPEDRAPGPDIDATTPEALAILLDKAAGAGARAWSFWAEIPTTRCRECWRRWR